MEKKRRGRKNLDIPADQLPNKARLLRLQAGYTIEELAIIIDINPQTLSAYELNGEGGRSFVYALANHFRIDPRELETSGKFFSKKLRHKT